MPAFHCRPDQCSYCCCGVSGCISAVSDTPLFGLECKISEKNRIKEIFSHKSAQAPVSCAKYRLTAPPLSWAAPLSWATASGRAERQPLFRFLSIFLSAGGVRNEAWRRWPGRGRSSGGIRHSRMSIYGPRSQARAPATAAARRSINQNQHP